jgi:hypothetical protein
LSNISINDEVGMAIIAHTEASIPYRLTPAANDNHWIRIFVADRAKLHFYASSVEISLTGQEAIIVTHHPEIERKVTNPQYSGPDH